MNKKCEVCNKEISTQEIADSEKFIGGNRYFCNKDLNRKMDW